MSQNIVASKLQLAELHDTSCNNVYGHIFIYVSVFLD